MKQYLVAVHSSDDDARPPPEVMEKAYRLTTDGPFAETKETLACSAPVEVRPFQEELED